MTLEEFRQHVMRETALLGDEPTLPEIDAAMSRLKALDYEGPLSDEYGGLAFLRGLARLREKQRNEPDDDAKARD